MVKKATKRKVATSAPRRSVTLAMSPVASDARPESQFAQGVIDDARAAERSEEEALSFLISRITDKVGEQGMGGEQMREFLTLLLDTDPTLKEEILQGITHRK
jgi:hypothetical protein